MTGVERLTAADGPQGDDWATGPVAAPVASETAEERKARQAVATDLLGSAMHRISSNLDHLDRHLPRAMEALADDLNYGALADTVAWLQAAKARLGVAEAYVARELGRLDGTPEIIELPDGRTAQVMKGKDRKEWRHADWQRDVRLAVLKAAEVDPEHDVIDAETGAFIDVADLLARVQAVHGSAAPKVTALKPLGLAADDYCSSYPGPYSVRVSSPTTTTEG